MPAADAETGRPPLRIAPLSRRSRRKGTGEPAAISWARESGLPEPSSRLVRARLWAWSVLAFRFFWGVCADRMRGWDGPDRRGARLRGWLETMGGAAVRVGRQLSLRADLLDFETCLELARLADVAPPMSASEAIARVEQATGQPLSVSFQRFDPTPRRSDTVSCEYRALLANGQPVRVRVRRPGVRMALATELRAIRHLCRLAEVLTLVPEGFGRRLEREQGEQLAFSVDMVRGARQQRLFRKEARRAGMGWLRTARVHEDLCSTQVRVIDQASGPTLTEVVAAVQQDTAASRAWLRSRGVQPRRLARRLLRAGWWSQLELAFFVVEPSADQLVVLPDDRLVWVDLGDCAQVDLGARRLYREALHRLALQDAPGATDVLMHTLGPFPAIDVQGFRAELERRMWSNLFGLLDKDGPVDARTTVGLWLDLMQAAAAHQIPVSLDILRLMRAALCTEHLAGRLWPRLDLLDTYTRYEADADHRQVDRTLRELEKQGRRDPAELHELAREERQDLFRKLRFLADHRLRHLPVDHVSLTAKGAFVANAMLRLAFQVLVLAAVALAAGVLWTSAWPAPVRVLGHPAFWVGAALVCARTLRRIHRRLGDREDG